MLTNAIAGQTLLISLRSWRYILAAALIAYLFTAVLFLQQLSAFFGSVSLISGLITLFFCWRLWMDEQFFRLFYQNEADRERFDLAIRTLWSKEMKPRTLEERWAGVRKLIYRGWASVALQWLSVIAMLIFATVNK